MWLVLLALRRPITVVVAVLAVVLSAGLAIRRAPVDILPDLGVPVIYVVQPFAGMSPSQMEGQLVTYYEYHFLYIAGIEHIESQSIQGMAMLKLYFHPGTNIAGAMAQVTAMTFRSTAFMPPGTVPAFIVRFDAGSVPVGQLVFSSPDRGEAEIQDLALYRVRPVLATLPGVSAPPPSGGKVRTIVVYLDPERLRSYRVSPDEVAGVLARGNLTLPAGNVRVGDRTTIASTNAMVRQPQDLGNIPLRMGQGPTVYLRDVGRIEDGADIVYNIALVNGRRTVYMPVTKRADASTLDVVRNLRAALPRMRSLVPEDLHIELEFDQSIYVTAAVKNLVTEGVLGALLTSLVVLLFLGNWRAALIVVLTIPFSILAAVVGLRLAGHTVNIMTLGGLALAVGILVDEATVAIENIHAHLGRGPTAAEEPPGSQTRASSVAAILAAMREVMLPRFLAMVCVIAVFIPSFIMEGIGRSLFPPLALAVAFSMIASYLLSSTLVPVLSVWLLGHRPSPAPEAGRARPGLFLRLQDAYGRLSARLLRWRWAMAVGYVALCAPLLLLADRLGTELFPRVDTGQFQLRIRAADGTRLERTVEIVQGVDRTIRELLGPGVVRITLANIGSPAWSFPVNGVYVWNGGPHEALLLVSLHRGQRPAVPAIEEALRHRLKEVFPGVRFSFEAGDIVSQVLNFGAPTPINVTVAGNKLAETRAFAERIARRLKQVPRLRDVQIPVALDYPTLNVEIDRERAGQHGVSVDSIGRSIVAATSSSVLTTPNFWTNPETGIPYRVAIRVPESQVRSAEDLGNLPVMREGAARPLVSDVAGVVPGKTPGQIDHYNSQRTVSVIAGVAGNDLGRALREVEAALRELGAPPRGSTVTLRGQVAEMRKTLGSLREGLVLAVIVVLLVLGANFQSLREPLAVLMVVPAVLAGVVLALLLSGSTLNVQSMMGAIMAIGVAVANAVLLVTFAREAHRQGAPALEAARLAARSRLRPVLMTSVAMVLGMVPMAIGAGEGGAQAAPLGRAVIGGLLASTVATLVFLPSLYALLAGRGVFHEVSLAPGPGSAKDGEIP